MHRVDAPVQAQDARRGAGREDRAHVVVGDPRGIEREDPFLERRVHRERPQDRALLQVPGRDLDRAADGACRTPGCGEREQDGEKGAQAAQASASSRLSMQRLNPAMTPSTSARENSAVRNVTPTFSASRAVVTASTIGHSGPVETALR